MATQKQRPGVALSCERGQLIPLYLFAIAALLVTGLVLFQVGRASDLRAGAQTAADAAALAAGREVGRQLAGPAAEHPDRVDDAIVRAVAADYARRNDGALVSYARRGLDVLVTVTSAETLDDTGLPGLEGGRAAARARAHVEPFYTIIGRAGAVPTGELRGNVLDAIRLGEALGLVATSTLRPGDSDSLHSLGIAADLVGPPQAMERFFWAALERYGYIEELFYDPVGAVDKNAAIPPIGGHSDHVHIALTGGGPGRPPEPGDRPELAPLEAGMGGRILPVGSAGDRAAAGQPRPDAPGSENGPGCEPSTPEGSAARDRGPAAGLDNAVPALVYSAGKQLGVTGKQMLAAFEAGLLESRMSNLSHGDRGSFGVFQQSPAEGWGRPARILDPERAAVGFFQAARRLSQKASAGQLAARVQRSSFPQRYERRERVARRLIERVARDERRACIRDREARRPVGAVGEPRVRLVPYADG